MNLRPCHFLSLSDLLLCLSFLFVLLSSLCSKLFYFNFNVVITFVFWILNKMIGNLVIFPVISLIDIVSINELTGTKNYRSVWCRTHYDATDKNNSIFFGGLNNIITVLLICLTAHTILVIMSVSTFKTADILNRTPTILKSEGEVTSLSGADKREVRDNREKCWEYREKSKYFSNCTTFHIIVAFVCYNVPVMH